MDEYARYGESSNGTNEFMTDYDDWNLRKDVRRRRALVKDFLRDSFFVTVGKKCTDSLGFGMEIAAGS